MDSLPIDLAKIEKGQIISTLPYLLNWGLKMKTFRTAMHPDLSVQNVIKNSRISQPWTSCPAARDNGWPLPGAWCWNRRFSYWMNPWAPW